MSIGIRVSGMPQLTKFPIMCTDLLQAPRLLVGCSFLKTRITNGTQITYYKTHSGVVLCEHIIRDERYVLYRVPNWATS